MKPFSMRGQEWLAFSSEVLQHIEDYTVPQYGDKGSDQCSEFEKSDYITNMKRYLNRFGRNARPGQDRLDMIKVAHYAQMLAQCLIERG